MQRDYDARDLTDRPDQAEVDKLRHYPPAFVSDYLKQIGIRNHVIQGVYPLSPFESYRDHLAGTAITLQFAPCREEEHAYQAPYMISEVVIEHAKPGDVVVVAGGGAPYAFWGDHLTHQAINSQVAGAVIDGYLRDSRPIKDTRFPIFTTGITMDVYVRRFEVVGYNVPVVCGGAMVSPGDVIVGDDDGCVVVPRSLVSDVVRAMPAIDEAEELLLQGVQGKQPWHVLELSHKTKYLREPRQ